jgi:hypothetical protein
MKKKNIKSAVIRFAVCFSLGMAMNPALDALSEESNMETISEVDFSFFLTNPKLPWGSDPFVKQPGYVNMQGPKDEYSLNGIVYSKNVPMAVINGKVVKEGDKVSDRRVTLIGDNFVILKKNDSEIELTLPPILEDDSEEDADGNEGEK